MREPVAHCHLIASVLAADGIMHEAEREFLDRAMTRLGLTEEERKQVMYFENAEGAAESLRGLSEEDRRKVVDDLVAAALVDGKLSPHETAIVKRIREALGL